MNIETKSRWQIRMVTLSIFVLGFVAGAFALNAYHLWFSAQKSPSRRERFDETINQLKLNDGQRAEVQQILGETREKIQKLRQESEPGMQEIRTQTNEKLQRVMTPEQWQGFQVEREKLLQSHKSKSQSKESK